MVDIKDNLSAEEHNDLGVLYEKQEKYDLAEKEYSKAVKKSKEWAVPYFNLGNLYFKKRDHKRSEEMYRSALRFDDAYSDCMNNLAFLLYTVKRYPEAKIYIESALSIKKEKAYLETQRSINEALNRGKSD